MISIHKIGTKWPAEPLRGWRDGQIVDFRPDDYKIGLTERKHFAFIRWPIDFWAFRGTTDWKAWNANIEILKKYLCPKDSTGKYKWEFGSVYRDEARLRCRDWFIDYKYLLNEKLIKQQDFQKIYDQGVDSPILTIDRDFTTLLFNEDTHTRLDSIYSGQKGSISTGTYQIGTGAGADYATIGAFEADLAASLTGDTTGEHQDEETATTADVVFNLDTNGHLLKLTAESGAEHTGGAYGNGARIALGVSDNIDLQGSTNGEFEVSNLALDISATDAIGFRTLMVDPVLFNRILIKGGANSTYGFYLDGINGTSDNITLRNSIIYDVGDGSPNGGIIIYRVTDTTYNILNNTVIACYDNIVQEGGGGDDDSLVTVKNNLCQAGQNSDFRDDGAGFGTTSKNVSEDATSPDASYRSKDVHTNSVFQDYGNDDFRLDSGGDSTNLAILDDGDDLSGTFTDDIQGQTRSTWYIGASEIVAAGGLSIPVAMHHYTKNIPSGR